MVKITPFQIPTTQQKNRPSKIFHCHGWTDPPTAISNTLNCPFEPKKDFWGKLANIIITFVYLLFPMKLKCLKTT